MMQQVLMLRARYNTVLVTPPAHLAPCERERAPRDRPGEEKRRNAQPRAPRYQAGTGRLGKRAAAWRGKSVRPNPAANRKREGDKNSTRGAQREERKHPD